MFEPLHAPDETAVFSYVLHRQQLQGAHVRALREYESHGHQTRRSANHGMTDDGITSGLVGWAFAMHNADPHWRWSLSHTETSIAVAISPHYHVGIDIEEWSRHVPFPVGLTPAESFENQKLNEPMRSQHFLTLWVQKEARFKSQRRTHFEPSDWPAEIVPSAHAFASAVASSSLGFVTDNMRVFRRGPLIGAVARTPR